MVSLKPWDCWPLLTRICLKYYALIPTAELYASTTCLSILTCIRNLDMDFMELCAGCGGHRVPRNSVHVYEGYHLQLPNSRSASPSSERGLQPSRQRPLFLTSRRRSVESSRSHPAAALASSSYQPPQPPAQEIAAPSVSISWPPPLLTSDSVSVSRQQATGGPACLSPGCEFQLPVRDPHAELHCHIQSHHHEGARCSMCQITITPMEKTIACSIPECNHGERFNSCKVSHRHFRQFHRDLKTYYCEGCKTMINRRA